MRIQPGLRLGLDADAASVRQVLEGKYGKRSIQSSKIERLRRRVCRSSVPMLAEIVALVGPFGRVQLDRRSKDWRDLDLLVFDSEGAQD